MAPASPNDQRPKCRTSAGPNLFVLGESAADAFLWISWISHVLKLRGKQNHQMIFDNSGRTFLGSTYNDLLIVCKDTIFWIHYQKHNPYIQMGQNVEKDHFVPRLTTSHAPTTYVAYKPIIVTSRCWFISEDEYGRRGRMMSYGPLRFSAWNNPQQILDMTPKIIMFFFGG